jgi:hypothetical protein
MLTVEEDQDTIAEYLSHITYRDNGICNPGESCISQPKLLQEEVFHTGLQT